MLSPTRTLAAGNVRATRENVSSAMRAAHRGDCDADSYVDELRVEGGLVLLVGSSGSGGSWVRFAYFGAAWPLFMAAE